jgi:hypothetical protein
MLVSYSGFPSSEIDHLKKIGTRLLIIFITIWNNCPVSVAGAHVNPHDP